MKSVLSQIIMGAIESAEAGDGNTTLSAEDLHEVWKLIQQERLTYTNAIMDRDDALCEALQYINEPRASKIRAIAWGPEDDYKKDGEEQ